MIKYLANWSVFEHKFKDCVQCAGQECLLRLEDVVVSQVIQEELPLLRVLGLQIEVGVLHSRGFEAEVEVWLSDGQGCQNAETLDATLYALPRKG